MPNCNFSLVHLFILGLLSNHIFAVCPNFFSGATPVIEPEVDQPTREAPDFEPYREWHPSGYPELMPDIEPPHVPNIPEPLVEPKPLANPEAIPGPAEKPAPPVKEPLREEPAPDEASPTELPEPPTEDPKKEIETPLNPPSEIPSDKTPEIPARRTMKLPKFAYPSEPSHPYYFPAKLPAIDPCPPCPPCDPGWSHCW